MRKAFIAATSLLLLGQQSRAVESGIKTRVRKDFAEHLFATNLPLFFKSALQQQVRDIEIPSLRTKMRNIRITITPRDKNYSNLDLEMFLDDDG